MKHIATRKIGKSDIEVTRLGYGGTALMGKDAPKRDADACRVIEAAFEQGIRYFDTSPFYGSGLSELRLGAGLRHLPRNDIVLSTKVGRLLVPDAAFADEGVLPFKLVFDYSKKGAVRSLEHSLLRLGTDRIDLLIVHDVSHRWHGDNFENILDQAISETLPTLAKLRDKGVIGAIGVGTNDLDAAVPMAASGMLDCIMIAREYNLLNHSALLQRLLPVCTRNNVSLLCAAPFASGILATGPVNGATYMYAPPDEDIHQKLERINAQCTAFGVPLRAAALQFADNNPIVSSVVAGLRSEREIQDAVDAFNYPIPPAFWDRLKEQKLIDQNAPTDSAVSDPGLASAGRTSA